MRAEHATAGSPGRAPALVERLSRHIESSRLLPEGARLTLALSGGIDSVVLLDLLLALRERWGWELSAAHFDHRMREGSEADAEWARALCQKLDLTIQLGQASDRPLSESHARELRYDFLLEARAALGGEWLVTAHHADDQSETVLFRILRGTGLVGLAGIPARRPPRVVRPLLPFWRAELEAYASLRGLEYLSDSTNLDVSIARNRIRHRLIPEIEANASPDFRRDLHRLAELARRTVHDLEKFTERAADELVLEAAESRVVVARSGFLVYDTEAQAHLLRDLVARVGPRPSRAGTRVALKFIKNCSSGRRIELAGGVVVRREFDRLILERKRPNKTVSDCVLVVAEPGDGAGDAWIGGARWGVHWSRGLAAGEGEPVAGPVEVDCFDLTALRFPLTVRSWQPGDRIQLAAGTRKLKKLFVDRRVGRSERARYPVLADRAGVLWVVGLTRGTRGVAWVESDVFTMSLRREQ